MRSFLVIFKGVISVDAGSCKAGGTGTAGNVFIKLGIRHALLLHVKVKKWRAHVVREHFTASCSGSLNSPHKKSHKERENCPKDERRNN